MYSLGAEDPKETVLTFEVDTFGAGVRIDRFVSSRTSLSRSLVQKYLATGHITVFDESVKPSYRLQLGDEVTCVVPEPVEDHVLPENIPLDVLYEDPHLIVLNNSFPAVWVELQLYNALDWQTIFLLRLVASSL